MDQADRLVIPDDALPLIKWGQNERLTCRQAAIIALVRENPGSSASAIAHVMGVPKPVITRAVDKLIRWKLIKRTYSNLDRRVIELWPLARKVK
jgi:DNA-binding MarR family transcriptional regulator